MPKFSVIIPTYNRIEMLREALASVVAQTYKDYEVIVVDDGSSDGTWQYLESLGEQIIPLRQKNLGPGAARNLAAVQAQGEYLAFLDSDDLWFPSTLELYAEAIKSFDSPSLISGKGVEECIKGIERPTTPVFTGWPCLLDACNDTTPPVGGTPSVAIRREVFKRLGGFVSRKINAEDIDLWLRAGNEVGFVRIDSPPVFSQRYVEVTASKIMNAQIAGVLFVMENENNGVYPGGVNHQRRRERIIAAMARSVSLECLRERCVSSAWELYSQSAPIQVRLFRIRYLAAFPLLLLFQILKRD